VSADTPEAGKRNEPPQEAAERERRAKEAYEKGIVERGEAAVADEHGRLPPGVTHEIVGYDESGRPILKRRRFSAF
jgi:hypothetical protein